MKLRNRWLIKVIALVAVWVIRGWIKTLRHRFQALGANTDARQPGLRERFIYACWHEYVVLPICLYATPKVKFLVSRHADGELAAGITKRFDRGVIRGSSTRGGVEAIRQMLREGSTSHLGISPDGPRGPRRRVKLGLIYMAARTGLAIVPYGVGYQRAWRLKSWDRFAIPLPCSRAAVVSGPPIRVPESADREQLEHYRQVVEEALCSVTEMAESWAASAGKWTMLGRKKICQTVETVAVR